MGAPHCKAVRPKIFRLVKSGPKNGGFSRITGVNVKFFLTPKRNRVVCRITRENRFGGLGCGALEDPPKKKIAHTGKREIVTKFCMWVDIQDLIAYATFGDDRLRGLGMARGRISHSPIDLRRRPYNTLALPCECVISPAPLIIRLSRI